MQLDRRQSLVLESVRRFLRRSAPGHLLNLLAKARPQDFAPIYANLTDREQAQVFRILASRDQELGAALLSELPQGEGPALLRLLGPAASAALLDRCADDDAAYLLAELGDDEARAILEAMKPEEKQAVEQLLIYEEETAGRIMTPDVFSLHEETTVGEAIAALQAGGDVEMAFYLYVVDEREHLVGVLSLRELLLHPPETRLGELMNSDLITVQTSTDQEEVAKLAAKYDLLAIPVVDEQGRLVGMVTIDDVVDVLREEATEDIFRMAGTSEEERIEPSILKSVRSRFPWLLATCVGGILASMVIAAHQQTLANIWGLAAFLPVVLGMGGAAGNQAATVTIRGLATGRIHEGVFATAVARELGVAGLLGLLYGTLVGLASIVLVTSFAGWDSFPGWTYPLVIGLSLSASMLIATMVASMVPIALEKGGIDPAVSTNPFVSTSSDLLGSLTYVTLASWLLLQ
ncbi:MAG TPA: magnesium transporter [Acidobacteria bacterium]|nr:magnesium transporter [Acidobacteriota bacterium]